MTRKFHIVVKRDFRMRYSKHGFYLDGKWIRNGYIVTDGFCNIMPGGTWFLTIPEAMRAIRIWCETKPDTDKFWQKLREG